MIWFPCKKCGKTHHRPEASAGTMVFCDCGNGNTVPWESTAAEPIHAAPPPALPKGPDLGPIQFDPVTIPTPPAAAAPPKSTRTSYPNEPVDREDDRSTRRGRMEKRDPDFCFNHQRRPKEQVCADCEQSFCSDCLVKFQGEILCGPCKNFAARRQELPPIASTIARASVIISLIAGPLMICLLINSSSNSGIRVLSWLSLAPQVLALGLGVWALWDAEKEKKGGGQWVAITGVATAGLTCVLMVLLNLFASKLV
jgi:hypothetical protein